MKPQAQRGFTLIELVVTIIILAMLSAIALPRMFDNHGYSDRGYVDELAFTLRYAQKIAVASECNVGVTVDVAGYVAQQRAVAANSCVAAGAFVTQVMRTDGTQVVGTPPADVVISPAGPSTFEFAADGSLVAAGPALTVGVHTLTVDPQTGDVTVVP